MIVYQVLLIVLNAFSSFTYWRTQPKIEDFDGIDLEKYEADRLKKQEEERKKSTGRLGLFFSG
jgi:hypothetical protein